ncbi:photosystem II reaction center PsbP family protein [Patescibacteria group bacterium]|nr:photosystem II reaction center PsbP family protein [Patescibacteria group bacterium]
MPNFKQSLYLLGGFLFSVIIGIISTFLFVVNITMAQPVATEDDFNPVILYSAWVGQDPWAPCREWVDISNFNDVAKADAVTCVEKRDAALKERRDYYLAPDQGWHKASACYSSCTDTCFSDAAAIGIIVNCKNGYTPYPKSDVERTMISCKAECSKVSSEEEKALPSPNQVIRECCEAIEVSDSPEDYSCFDGIKNGDEIGVDCGGSCEEQCEAEYDVSITPKEVEMVADGKTSIEFLVKVTQDGKPVAGQEIGYRLQDERNQIEDNSEGRVIASAAKTDARGMVKLVYTTMAQPRDFATSTLVLQAVNSHGNPQARITLTPGFSILCGNWQCQTGETHANCPQDCAEELTRQQAYDYLVKKYNEIPLNPYARQGVWCASCPTNNRVLKAMAIETISSDEAKLEYAKRLKEKYEPWVCGSQQTRVINMLDGLRLSKDATERSIIDKYYDYGPVEVVAPYVLNTLAGHLAVAVYPKNTFWRDTAQIFDIWMKNNHGIYGIEDWEFMTDGRAGGFQCDPPFYPLCGGTYQRVKRPEYKLTTNEQQFYNNLSQEIKDKISASINERAYSDVRDAQKKYLIERMMEFDARDKVRVVVQCPFNVMVVNKETGDRVGYDAEGNFISEDESVYPEIRSYKDDEVISYFMLPNDGDYEVRAAGIDNGSATVMTSYPTEDGEFEIFEYNNIQVKNNSDLVLELDKDTNKAQLLIDGNEIKPELLDKGVNNDALDYLIDVSSGLYPEENQPGLQGQVFAEEYPSLMFEPTFDGWSLLLLFLALLSLVVAVIVVIIMAKRGKLKLGILIMVLLILLAIFFVGYTIGRYMQETEIGNDYRYNNYNEKQLTDSSDINTSVLSDEIGDSAASLEYKNDEYGYKLTMTPSWSGYTAETLPIDGENAVAVTQFYLPTQEISEYSDKIGWFKMMIINVYPINFWKMDRAACEEIDLCWDEEIGRDAEYVYAWSYFNGIQPSDIDEQAIVDMRGIVDSFVPSSQPKQRAWDVSTEMSLYKNCKYGYQLSYPSDWLRVTTDQSADDAIFSGDNLSISVHAVDYGMTLDEFVADRTAAWKQEPVSSRDQERDGKRLVAREYNNPDVVYVFWQEGDSNLELAIAGNHLDEFINGVGFFSDFNHNLDNFRVCN